MFVFGDNRKGQLGLGHRRRVGTPERVDFFETIFIKAVACSVNTLAITQLGTVYIFGEISGKIQDTPYLIGEVHTAKQAALVNDTAYIIDKQQ